MTVISTLKRPLFWSLVGSMTILSVAQPASAILGVWRRTAVRVAVVDTAVVTSAAASSAAAASAAQKAAAPATPAAAPAATPPK